MGTQMMASQSGGNGSGQQSQIQGLGRQGSFYNLTLNEVQNHLGEPLQSMNLDDLLKSVFPTETNPPLSIDLDGASSQYAVSTNLQRQGSITMPRALSKKTVDEVWKDIQQGKQKGEEEQVSSHEWQVTLGEMTLEDFLVKAGVVAEGIAKDANDILDSAAAVRNAAMPMGGSQEFAQGPHWLQQYQQMSMGQHMQGQHQHNVMGSYMPGRPVPQQLAVPAPMLDSVFPDSSPSLGTMSDSQTPGRKRGALGDVGDKLVERRQKRMIKNRESAARSRARKQAYTNELENKVIRLEEENERLKKQQEVDKILYAAPIPEPKYRLRRTSSALF